MENYNPETGETLEVNENSKPIDFLQPQEQPQENILLSEFKSFSDSFKEETDNSTKSDSFEEVDIYEGDKDVKDYHEGENKPTGNDIEKDTLSQGIALLFCYIAPIVVCYGYEYFAKKVVSNEARKAIEFTKREQSDISDALERTLEYYGRVKSDNPLTSLILLIFGVLASKIFILSTMEKEVKAEASASYSDYKERDNSSEVVLRKAKIKPLPQAQKRTVTCKKCGQAGHNSKTCKS